MAQEEFATGIHPVGRRFGKLVPTAEAAVRIRHLPRPNQRFEPLPAPTGVAPFHLDLAQVVSAGTMQAIEQAGRLVFHLTGDVGGVKAPQSQHLVATTMEHDFGGPGPVPSFLYIVGDVVYFYGETSQYYSQFYEPYVDYPAPIFAVPGNHDGDVIDASVASLAAFMANFCAPHPHPTTESGDTGRDAMTQPNPYWTLNTPYATLIGIYTNVPEGGRLDDHQISWLHTELTTAPTDRALILTMHHPALSADNHHSGSLYIDELLDQAIATSGRTPDLVVAGHVHNYQRFTRTREARQVPYLVAGAGGYWHLHTMAKDATGATLSTPWKVPDLDATLDSYVDDRHGYLRLTVSPTELHGDYITVPRPQESWHHGPTTTADSFTLHLHTHQLTTP
jgi:hypothetical protein